MQQPTRHCDVLVVGGGPAGTTAATLLKAKGWDVALVEKAHHPRFHVGESLLPNNMTLIDDLGLLKEVDALGVTKYGADFTSAQDHTMWRTSYFRNALNPAFPYAYHVPRDKFDQLLFENCKRQGVEVSEGITVRDVSFEEDSAVHVQGRSDTGETFEWRARLLVDGSGRDTFVSAKLGLKRKNPRHRSAAVFAHFKGAERREGEEKGNISIYWFDHGWIWMIPLRDGVMSIGAVCSPEFLKTRRGSLEEFLQEAMRSCAGVRERTMSAQLHGEAHATGNYSYSSTKMHGPGYVLLGDAFAFIDPVFSSGVYLAMQGAALAVDPIDATLRGAPDASHRMRAFDRRMRRAMRITSWFIYRFTSPTTRTLFMNPRNFLRMQSGVISVLAGDVFGKTRLTVPLTCFKAVYYIAAARDAIQNMLEKRKSSPALS